MLFSVFVTLTRHYGRVVKATDSNSLAISTSVFFGSAGSSPAGVVFWSFWRFCVGDGMVTQGRAKLFNGLNRWN